MRRTKHLLEQLLALARHEVGPPSEAAVVPLDRTVKDLVADFLPDASCKGIDLGFETIEPVATRGEPVMIATMIRNLIDNAVALRPEGAASISASIARAATLSCKSKTPGRVSLQAISIEYSSRSSAAAGRVKVEQDSAYRS
jgi:signal transduction histidine kinase